MKILYIGVRILYLQITHAYIYLTVLLDIKERAEACR